MDSKNEFTRKHAFHLMWALAMSHQRALLVPFREGYGREALGWPGFSALILIVVWAVFSQDPLMWCWLGLWMVCLIWRRIETFRLLRKGERIHSMYDGRPVLMDGFGRNWVSETTARLLLEPFSMLIWAGVAATASHELGYPYGLARFFLWGAPSLLLVEIVRSVVLRNRVQAMIDARLEQEALTQEFHQKWGE